MKNKILIGIVLFLTVLLLIVLCLIIFSSKPKTENLKDDISSYSFILDIHTESTMACYDANVDTGRHDLHFADKNYLDSETKYYRFSKENKQITYFTYACSGEYNEQGVCILKWSNYVSDYHTENEVESLDATRIYNAISTLYKEYHLVNEQEIKAEILYPLLNYLQFIDSTITFMDTSSFLVSTTVYDGYIQSFSIKSTSNDNEYITISFKNYNQYTTVEQLLEIDSRVNQP